MNFDDAFDRLIGHEGGYVNNPHDTGGETNWGVTARVARARGYAGDMRSLSKERAKQIARAEYWDPVRADDLPAWIRFDVFDAAYNSGVGQSAKWLQRTVGAAEDGRIGPATIAATVQAGPAAQARFNGHRLQFMTDLGNWQQFGRGWARRVASNLLGA
jgi:lysozyme family protein